MGGRSTGKNGFARPFHREVNLKRKARTVWQGLGAIGLRSWTFDVVLFHTLGKFSCKICLSRSFFVTNFTHSSNTRDFEMGDPQRLSGWKSIAAYVEKSPKTVQRWEKLEGFPILRIHVNKSVYAFSEEIDAWFETRKGRELSEPEPFPWKGLWRVLGLTLAGLVVLMLFYYFYFFLPPLKQRIFFVEGKANHNGSSLQIVDQDERVYLNFSSPSFCYANINHHRWHQTYWLSPDLNRNGMADVVFADCDPEAKTPLVVYQTNFLGRLVEKKFLPPLELLYEVGKERHMLRLVGDVELADLDGDGIDELMIVQRSSPYYPSSFRVFRQDGTELFRLLHPGHFQNVVARDLDGNGSPEVYLAGCNNRLHEYSLPVFLTLESDWRMEGECLDLIEYSRSTIDPGPELNIVYRAFPKITGIKAVEAYEHARIHKNNSVQQEQKIHLLTYFMEIHYPSEEGVQVSDANFFRQFVFGSGPEPMISYLLVAFLQALGIQNQDQLEKAFLKVFFYDGQEWHLEPCDMAHPFKAFVDLSTFPVGDPERFKAVTLH
jgi:hypothetical protein